MQDSYPEQVKRIIRFCELLTVPDGKLAGQKVQLSNEQKRFINAVYGPRTPEGIRIVREALLSMARKNAKTATIAMLVLVHLCGPEATRNAEIYSVAYEKEQAAQVFKYATAMIYASQGLKAHLNVIETQKKIKAANGSSYQALSRESKSKHGKSTSVLIFDEGAQYGQNRELLDVMITSMGAHESPLTFYISTQAANDAAWFSELVDKAKKINSGEIVDPHFVGFVYETPTDADPFDEKNWYLSNPHLGTFKSLEYMRFMANKAKESPSFLNSFLNLELNQRVASDAPFISAEVWKNNGSPTDIDLFDSGRPCFGGLDLSAKNDLTALVFASMDDDNQWHILPYFWTPKDNIRERSNSDRVPYDQWAREGFIEAVPGLVINYEYVARHLGECHSRFNIQGIRFDRWRIDYLKIELDRLGIPTWIEGKDEKKEDAIRLIPHGQGFKDFTPAVEILEDLLLEKKLCHGNNPILTMCAANTRVTKDPAGSRKFDKMKSNGRIDGIVALAMALNKTPEAEHEEQGTMDELFASEPIVVEW